MSKTAPTKAEMPGQGSFVPLDVDGDALPGDWTLRLAAEAGRALRSEPPLSAQIPITR